MMFADFMIVVNLIYIWNRLWVDLCCSKGMELYAFRHLLHPNPETQNGDFLSLVYLIKFTVAPCFYVLTVLRCATRLMSFVRMCSQFLLSPQSNVDMNSEGGFPNWNHSSCSYRLSKDPLQTYFLVSDGGQNSKSSASLQRQFIWSFSYPKK